MSEQLPPQPLYIVVNSYSAFSVAMRQADGTYAQVLRMQTPYDNAAAAQKACEALIVLDVKLKAVKPKKRKSSFIGTTP